MSAVRDDDHLLYAPMVVADIDEVFALEKQVYPHPWTRGNFADSLGSGYNAWVLRDRDGALLGYYLLMAVVDEAHLLNVAVAAGRQGEGLGRYLLDKVAACARGLSMDSILLEVRPSNLRALAVYEKYGYAEIGRRRGYYPAHDGKREDAIVMRFVL
ncbi:ribosomal protein S18-alanine N-acetyltransferase [Massilia sp. P8910]|uniref:[Ribosomal protein bS18]-alanine N-acetyltransferase n=1 Tax=Massilia antarctica TaxID=2765360 RepID=A0AA48WB11_9BURK|nr:MULTISPECIES: ribosomal protein S18-alanine N-acetyltransferase [Massilia]CUI03745.1 Ribosomal-protein-S18p-alanine acetyltransferase [Janthinobacterium sp. CG23_2]MCE3605129.1 ribosomal protein S18-alanine N-acetyltransferase [Massilia antarctica]MCY0912680.1 ribosomal protein S18-alanine N-acetyltransferase [Massilia sp. H27-R4]QPI49286.1 ribosomal protein S18-alanine N-acetyltransferase [Massilia antarctica]CUU27531.1 Ribosomal-protein-S18p-alanine acetyltransferase [Janthinobacterium sp